MGNITVRISNNTHATNKIDLKMFILLMRAALFAIPTVFLSAANPSNIDSLFPWRKTKQHVPATCFSNFENLYFSNPSATFFTVGKDIKLLDSINISDIRGYFWEENPPLTFSLKTITTAVPPENWTVE